LYEPPSQSHQIASKTNVNGSATAQYIQNSGEKSQEPSANEKKVVLKRACGRSEHRICYKCLSELTDMNVPGRKIMVRSVIDFITRLSELASML